MMYKYGIVVIGYKNAEGIARLLRALANADYTENNLLLLISIDYSGMNDVLDVAEDFQWNYGKKKIIYHTERIGLRNHVLSCGDYLNDYNLDALVVFEDDMYPSKDYFSFTKAATEKYINDMRIAGVSLHTRWINQIVMKQFYPMKEEGDNYFLQYSQSRGQVWFRKQWNDFRSWYERNGGSLTESEDIPHDVANWKDTSWLKYHIKYCVENEKYLVHPYISYSTCFGEVGEHVKADTNMWQVAISNGENNVFHLTDLTEDSVMYDAFFENRSLCKYLGLKKNEVSIDLFGGRTLVTTKYLLTTRKLEYPIVKTWGNKLIPHELNIIQNISGRDIYLYNIERLEEPLNLKLSQYKQDKYQIYYKFLHDWIMFKMDGFNLERYFNDKKWKRIAIYGSGYLGEILAKELKNTSIEIEYFLDRNQKAYLMEKPNYYQKDKLPKVDIVVITPYQEIENIKRYLEEKEIYNYICMDEIIS